MLRQTLALDPTNAMAHDLLGNLLSELGRFDEAHDCFAQRDRDRAADGRDPTTIWSGAARSRPPTPISSPGWRPPSRRPGWKRRNACRVHLALGKAADDLGDYALAMQHFDAADAVRRGSASFDSAAFDTRDRPPDRPLHARPDRARAANSAASDADAGADRGHAALRHHARRADRLQPSRGRRRRRAEFLERARGRVAAGRPGGDRGAVSRPCGGRLSRACSARSGRRRRG